MKSVVRIALVLALGFLSGCSSGIPPLPAMNGTWIFTFTPANAPTDVIQATAILTQNRYNAVFGPVTLSGSGTSCGTVAVMSGTIAGDNLSLQLTQSPGTLNLRGTANLQLNFHASGAYTATTGECLQNGGAGTWTAFLTSNNSANP
jgi:hypothetical protein